MQAINLPESSRDLDRQRVILRASINQIAAEVEVALRDASIGFPVYIAVRDSGGSIATIATPTDPTDDDWKRASTIACKVIGDWVGCDRLRGRELACAIANASRMISASEVSEGGAGDNHTQ
jgi:hypothetical protein